MNIPAVSEVFAAFFSASAQAGDPGHCADSRGQIEAEPDPDEPVPFTLTDQAEAALAEPEPDAEGGTMTTPDAARPVPELDAEAEWETEWADEWDSADSSAFMDRVEAGLEPEAEP